MATLEGFDFFPLQCDDNGKIENPAELQALTDHVTNAKSTDAIFFGHGFRNDENDALGLYSGFLQTFSAHLSRAEFAGVKTRTFVVCGIFWPSKTFKESFDEGAVQALDDTQAEKQEVRRPPRNCSTTVSSDRVL